MLAADVSGSMSAHERRIQRDGYVRALGSPKVAQAFLSGALGRIAVTYVEWAAASEQLIVTPWTVVASEGELAAFAGSIAAGPHLRSTVPATSISAGLVFAANMIGSSGVTSFRRVIDVSGNGPNDDGPPVDRARDVVVSGGITINGIAVATAAENVYGPYAYLFGSPEREVYRYYAEHVIGGPGAFVLAVGNLHDFAETLERKLILEVAGLPAVNLAAVGPVGGDGGR